MNYNAYCDIYFLIAPDRVVPLFSPAEYVSVVVGARLWPYLLECLQGLGEGEAGLLSTHLIPLLHTLPPLERLVVWTGLTCTVLHRQSAAPILKGSLSIFLPAQKLCHTFLVS